MRTLVDAAGPEWAAAPVRFLVLDLALVAGVDMSAAEAFVRIQRLLAVQRVVLVFCGFAPETPIGRALRSVDLLEMEGVELFATFNDALECESYRILSSFVRADERSSGTENAYLKAWFNAQKLETQPIGM